MKLCIFFRAQTIFNEKRNMSFQKFAIEFLPTVLSKGNVGKILLLFGR